MKKQDPYSRWPNSSRGLFKHTQEGECVYNQKLTKPYSSDWKYTTLWTMKSEKIIRDKAIRHIQTNRQTNTKYLQKNVFTRLFPSVPIPNAWLARCVYVSVWELLLEGLCVISFRQETGNGVEAITLGESPRAPRNEGQGPVSTHGCVCVWVCVSAGRVQPVTFFQWAPHDLFTVPLSNFSLRTHIHTCAHGQTHDF